MTAAERRATEIVDAARAAGADLVGVDPAGIVFGRSMTQLTYDFARTLAKSLGPRRRGGGDAAGPRRQRPPVGAGRDGRGRDRAVGRRSTRPPACSPPDDVARVLSARTRLVALTAASNLLGSRPDVATIAATAHAAGALVYVDGVHYTPHAFVDVAALGADFFACSPYKFLGPHLGMLAAAPALLEELQPDKLLPATDVVPERFEFGTLPYELLAGTTAAIDFLADLAPGTGHSPSQAGDVARKRSNSTSRSCCPSWTTGRRAYPAWSATATPNRRRTPTTLFTVTGVAPAEVYQRLAERGVNAPAGTFYAHECAKVLGIEETGAVRAGIAPYTDKSDVDRLLEGVAEVSNQ